MSRIEEKFEELKSQGRKALIPFVTAGDPDPAITVPLMHAMAGAGADIIELGVPFSDPMADGPTIQRASERALQHKVGLKDVLAMVITFRKTDTRTPVVLMGYANPIERMGYSRFSGLARECGVDGVLTVDYPPEESGALAKCLEENGLDPIFLLSPTTPDDRFAMVTAMARGFVYYVSLKGVTGAANLDLQDVRGKLSRIRAACSLPIGVGFGIRDPETARQIAEFADAVVIGSRIVQEVENAPRDALLDNVSAFVRSVRAAMDGR